MALTTCGECKREISTTAKACPHCGAKVPHFKWWLWVPIALVVAFLAFGASIPEHEAKARQLRRTCEQMGGSRYDCDGMYDRAMEEGRRAAAK